MTTWIALLRGVNVGGRNKLPMKELTGVLEAMGCHNVRTYIQSGNALFTPGNNGRAQLAADLSRAIDERCGFAPGVIVLEERELTAAIDANPLPEAASNPTSLHLFFLDETPHPEATSRLAGVKAATESVVVKDRVLYLHAPDGIARSRLAQQVERLLGTRVTGRNWRTIRKIADMACASS